MADKKSDDLNEHVGYYGEQLVLLAQTLGLNTCWVGLSYSKVPGTYVLEEGEKIACYIALGYGETQGVGHKVKTVETIKTHPLVPKDIVVRGFIIDSETGALEEIRTTPVDYWKSISDNATEISLHDQHITQFIRKGNDIVLVFKEGFFVDKEHPQNSTDEHQFTTGSAIILQDGKLIGSEEGVMDGMEAPPHIISEDSLFTDSYTDVLVNGHTWSSQKHIFSIETFPEEPSRYLNLTFQCSRVIVCWNEFAHGDWVDGWHDLWKAETEHQ